MKLCFLPLGWSAPCPVASASRPRWPPSPPSSPSAPPTRASSGLWLTRGTCTSSGWAGGTSRRTRVSISNAQCFYYIFEDKAFKWGTALFLFHVVLDKVHAAQWCSASLQKSVSLQNQKFWYLPTKKFLWSKVSPKVKAVMLCPGLQPATSAPPASASPTSGAADTPSSWWQRSRGSRRARSNRNKNRLCSRTCGIDKIIN